MDPRGPVSGSVRRVECDAAHDLEGRRRLLAQWAQTWALTGLEGRLQITFSRRFRTSLGRCAPASGEIRLAEFLLAGPPAVLREVLCHEAAHAAVHELHGAVRRPHGVEWRALMRAAGFEPRARLPANLLPDLVPQRRRTARLQEHRCPVCHAARLARRRVPQWRCTACRAAGLEGELVVARVSGPAWRRRLIQHLGFGQR